MPAAAVRPSLGAARILPIRWFAAASAGASLAPGRGLDPAMDFAARDSPALASGAVISPLQFRARTPLGFFVECDVFVWNNLVRNKHPVMAGLDTEVHAALERPIEIRRSRRDTDGLLFYRPFRHRLLCAVVLRRVPTSFLVTAYPTDAIKQGELVWTRSA